MEITNISTFLAYSKKHGKQPCELFNQFHLTRWIGRIASKFSFGDLIRHRRHRTKCVCRSRWATIQPIKDVVDLADGYELTLAYFE